METEFMNHFFLLGFILDESHTFFKDGITSVYFFHFFSKYFGSGR